MIFVGMIVRVCNTRQKMPKHQFLTIKTNLFTFILGDGESTISLPLFFLLIFDKYILCMLIYAQCLVSDHTMLNTPVLVRSLKLVNIGPGQYLDARLLDNSGCCWRSFCLLSSFSQQSSNILWCLDSDLWLQDGRRRRIH